MNGYYIRQLSVPDLTSRLMPYLEQAAWQQKDRGYVEQIVPLIQENRKLSDI